LSRAFNNFELFRLRPRKSKTESESPTKVSKEAQKKKVDDKAANTAKAGEENATETEQKPTLPCRIPFSGMFPFKDEKVSGLSASSRLGY